MPLPSLNPASLLFACFFAVLPAWADTTPPVIIAPATVDFTCGSAAGVAAFFSATATDDVTAAPTVTYSIQPGTVLAPGSHGVVITAADEAGNTATKNLTVTVTQKTFSGTMRVAEGGQVGDGTQAVSSGNLAPGGTVFVKDTLAGSPVAAAVLTDFTYHLGKWVAGSSDSFAGVSFGDIRSQANAMAFGREGSFDVGDRFAGTYTLQFTQAPNPGSATPDAAWVTLGSFTYPAPTEPFLTQPSIRHLYRFRPVEATGYRVRLQSAAGEANYISLAEFELMNEALPPLLAFDQNVLLTSGDTLTLPATETGQISAPRTVLLKSGDTSAAIHFRAEVIAGDTSQFQVDLSQLVPVSGLSLNSFISVRHAPRSPGAHSLSLRIYTTADIPVFDLQFAATAVDTTPPVLTVLPEGTTQNYQTTDPTGMVPNLAALISVSDNSQPAPTITTTPPLGTKLAIGPHTIFVLATDAAGLTTTRSFNIHIFGVPIAQLGALSVDVGAAEMGRTTEGRLNITNAGAGTLHVSGYNITGPQSAEFSFDGFSLQLEAGQSGYVTVGLTPVNRGAKSATLMLGLNDPALFTVFLPLSGMAVDTLMPVITPGADIAVTTTSTTGRVVTYPALTVTDNDSVPPVVTYSHSSGSVFPTGMTTVTVTATDAAGNAASSTFQVMVTPLPLLEVESPPGTLFPGNTGTLSYGEVLMGSSGRRSLVFRNAGAAALNLSAVLTGTDYTSSALTTSLAPGAESTVHVDVAPTAVGVRSGQYALTTNDTTRTAVTFQLSADGRDTTPPVLQIPPTREFMAGDASGVGVWHLVTATDNSGSANTITYTPPNGSKLPVGTNDVSVTATDPSGNASTGQFQVIVKQPPQPWPVATYLLPLGDVTQSAGFGPSLAQQGTGFALSVLDGDHGPQKLNDGIYSPGSLYVSGSTTSSAGIRFFQRTKVNRLVFSRDRTGIYKDGVGGYIGIDYTQHSSPGATSPADTWVNLGEYTIEGANVAPTARFFAITFPEVEVTAIRIRQLNYTQLPGIDEIEICLQPPVVALRVEQPAGQALAATTSVVDYGHVELGEPALQKTFTVQNTVTTGTTPLVFTPTLLDGPGFVIDTTGTNLSLAPGESTTFKVIHQPVPGAQAARLRLMTNDPEHRLFDIPLRGSAADTLAPVITPPAPISLLGTTAAGATVNYPPPSVVDAYDAAPVVTVSPPSGSFFANGVHSVTITATDATGNTATASFTITVLADTLAPVITPPAPIRVNALMPAGITVSYPAFSVVDNRDPAPLVTVTPPSGSMFAPGTHTVTISAVDDRGNSSATSFTVTVVPDTQAPLITPPEPISMNALNALGSIVSYPAFSVVDDRDPVPVVSVSPPSGSLFAPGQHTVTITATDVSGNASTASFTVTVVPDTLAPVITPPAPISVNALSSLGEFVTYPAYSVVDNRDPAPLVTVSSPSGSRFAPGLHPVTITATDASGNTSTASFTVTVVPDTQAPVITPPAAITVASTSAAGAIVSYPAASAVDNRDPAPVITFSHASGSLFAPGASTVTITSVDASGNSASASFTVTVTQFPVLSIRPQPATLDFGTLTSAGVETTRHEISLFNAGYGPPLILSSLSISGPAADYEMDLTALPMSLTVGHGGTLGVVWRPQGHGTRAATLSFQTNDPLRPQITFQLTGSSVDRTPPRFTYVPPDQTFISNGVSSTGVTLPLARAVDGSGQPVTITYSGAPITLPLASLQMGMTTITATATDAAGMTATASYRLNVELTNGEPFPALSIGGTVHPGSVLPTATVTTTSSHDAAHGADKLSDGLFGDSNAWIAGAAEADVVIRFGATPRTLNRFAFGRDNTGVLRDRFGGNYFLQYSQASDPATAGEEQWCEWAYVIPYFGVGQPWWRKTYRLEPKTVTAVRLRILTGGEWVAIDELELWHEPALEITHQNQPLMPGDATGVDFGLVGAGTSSTPQSVTLRNVTSTPVTLQTLTFAGDQAADFVFTAGVPALPHALAPGATLTLGMAFQPATSAPANAARRGLFRITTNHADAATVDTTLLGTVRDITPPVFQPAMANMRLYADGMSPVFPLLNITAMDDQGPLTFGGLGGIYGISGPELFAPGSHAVQLVAYDSQQNHAANSFTLGVSPGLPERGIGQSATAFAKDVIAASPHSIAAVNDGVTGNASSWIGAGPQSFVGLSFGSTSRVIHRIAFGRDATGAFTDRWQGTYEFQYTTVPNPDAATPDTSWSRLGILDLRTTPPPGSYFAQPWLRHSLAIAPVAVTGIRILTTSSADTIAIDELEAFELAIGHAGWLSHYFTSGAAGQGHADDPDGDGLSNLIEFAFGTSPTSPANRSLSRQSDVIIPGSPMTDGTSALFIRRKDHATAGLTYTVEFSPDLITWTPTSITLTVLADDGTHEVVSVPMPALQIRHFFRVKVNTVP